MLASVTNTMGLSGSNLTNVADEVIETEETFVELNVEAILEAAERVEIVRDIAAGGVEAILEAAEESRLYGRPLKKVEGPGIKSRPH